MRAQRIFGAKLGELQDPLMEVDVVTRTPLQNAVVVSHNMSHHMTLVAFVEWSEKCPNSYVLNSVREESHSLLALLHIEESGRSI